MSRKLLGLSREVIEALLETQIRPPIRNCSCHISPPCNDCLNYSGLREAMEDAQCTVDSITTALAQPEPVDIRVAFESHFGVIPKGCVWNGQGFSLTAFNAWEATNYANKFEGFVAAWKEATLAPILAQHKYPNGNVAAACVCGSWPGGDCLKCEWIPPATSILTQSSYAAGMSKKDAEIDRLLNELSDIEADRDKWEERYRSIT
jgi:hypothetical protein